MYIILMTFFTCTIGNTTIDRIDHTIKAANKQQAEIQVLRRIRQEGPRCMTLHVKHIGKVEK